MKTDTQPIPFARSYWILPGMFLAGEFPGAKSPLEMQIKLGRLIDCGIRKIINLMEPDETDYSGDQFNSYEGVVSQIAEEKKISVDCQRFPIVDLCVPAVAQMMEILDAIIAGGIASGNPTYVHCRGGIGRTGTVVGCFLLKNGLAHAGNVLDIIAGLRRNDPEAYRTAPETEIQRQFVANWGDSDNGPPTCLSRTVGCVLGGASGDALGAPVEFLELNEIRRLYGDPGITQYAEAYGRKGAITDDTQMSLFTIEGLLRAITRRRTKGAYNPSVAVHHAYVQWLNTQGYKSENSFNNSTAGLLINQKALWSRRAPGNSCLTALMNADMGTMAKPINNSKGCGGVMRAAPAGLISGNAKEAFSLGCKIAAITHGHPTGYFAAGALAAIIFHIKNGCSLNDSISMSLALLEKQPNHGECSSAIRNALDLFMSKDVNAEDIMSLGEGWTAEEALAISLVCALTYESDFDKALVLAVNHSGDSDSTGAITGNLLGCLLGSQGIEKKWTDDLEMKDLILSLAVELFIGSLGCLPAVRKL